MSLTQIGAIEIPDAQGSSFDHGAFDPATRRVFLAHTGRDRVEVFDHDARHHLATLEGFPESAGVVAGQGDVLVTNRSSASLAWVDARSLKTRATFETAPRPNGVALVASSKLAIAACIGDDRRGPELQSIELQGGARWAIELPGRPRWCVVSADGRRVFLAIRDPSMVLVASLPRLDAVQHWKVPAAGAHGLDIDHRSDRLYAACDGCSLVEVDAADGAVRNQWPLAGEPDATFFDPASGLIHVAVAHPGVVQSVDPRTGRSSELATGAGAKTTALVPDGLYVFSPAHRGVLVLGR